MTINNVYRNKKNNQLYILLYPCKVKNVKTREWEDGYVYRTAYSTEVFVRTIKDFYEKFDTVTKGSVKFVGPKQEWGLLE